jgi:hypothetical protein
MRLIVLDIGRSRDAGRGREPQFAPLTKMRAAGVELPGRWVPGGWEAAARPLRTGASAQRRDGLQRT